MSKHTTLDSATPKLTTIPMFADLSADSLRTLTEIVVFRRYAKGQVIIAQADVGTCMYFLMSGRVKVSLTSTEGRELVLDYLEAPAHFGEMSLVDAQSRSADVIAVTDVSVYALEGKDLSTAIQLQPRLALSLIATLSRRLRTTISRLEDLAFLDATHRVMRIVLNVATAGLETRGAPVVQGMTHHDIATLAGTSRETASRVISQLSRDGIITAKGRRLTVDLSRLSERLERP
jgi:CRP/FNR family transcriptional regulator/CRP/FNR family cyclic AMP-dependent transcriptional regulator